ncbi:MAG: RluA family pseudouridine synthase [bacterium]|nr:RluA family pseudouridine synthase [bacterium]MCP5067213.1 RluA family pseudouridine synthase [bacterium]
MSEDSRPAPGGYEGVVGPNEDGWRLDAYLAASLGISRARARRALARGTVTWRERPAGLDAKGAPIAEGDRIQVVREPDPSEALPLAEPDAPLEIVASGDGWVALDKPAGTPVHPLEVDEGGSLANALIARHPELQGVGEGGLRSGVVHRLDVDTSGVLLFALREDAWQRLREAFRSHKVEKTYLAIVAGRLEGEGELALQLSVGRHRPAKVRVLSKDDARPGRGRPTRTRWRSRVAGDEASLVEAWPATGFLHQIRVSLAHLGHPILGDSRYGGPEHPLAPRQMLHARQLRWKDVEAGCEPPADFAAAIRRLGLED